MPNARYIKSAYLTHGTGVVKKKWGHMDVVSTPITDTFGLALGCRTSVVPIRQFSETRRLEQGEDSSMFYSFDGLDFVDLADGNGRAAPASCTLRRGLAEQRDLPGVHVRGAGADPDLRDKVAYAYLQRALEDEAEVLLGLACCGDGGRGSGTAQDARQMPPWIDGATGAEVEDPSHSQGASALTCRGLDAAKKKLDGHGLNADSLVCYTTVKALHDLSMDPEFTKWNQATSGIADGCMREYNGILLIACPSLPLQIQNGGAKEPRAPRSVVFVPNASFGLVCDDLVSISEEQLGDDKLRFSATHKAGGVLKYPEAVCCLLHA